jgi:hypothetical protein
MRASRTVIRVEDSADHLHALDRASIDIDLRPFASFIATRMLDHLKKAKA